MFRMKKWMLLSALVLAVSAVSVCAEEETEVMTEETEMLYDDVIPEEADPGVLMGGWTAAEETEVTEDVQKAFDAVTEKLLGVDYEPVALLATQVVSGTNYCILCKKTPVTENPQTSFCLMYMYVNLQNEAELLQIQDIAIGLD